MPHPAMKRRLAMLEQFSPFIEALDTAIRYATEENDAVGDRTLAHEAGRIAQELEVTLPNVCTISDSEGLWTHSHGEVMRLARRIRNDYQLRAAFQDGLGS